MERSLLWTRLSIVFFAKKLLKKVIVWTIRRQKLNALAHFGEFAVDVLDGRGRRGGSIVHTEAANDDVVGNFYFLYRCWGHKLFSGFGFSMKASELESAELQRGGRVVR